MFPEQKGQPTHWARGILTVALVVLTAGVARPEPQRQQRTDRDGVALPEGALARLGSLRWRHGSAIAYVAFLPDGKGVITASPDGLLRLWDRRTGQEIRRFGKGNQEVNPGQPGPRVVSGVTLSSVVLSPDGKAIAAAEGLSVHVWDVTTGKELLTLRGSPQGVYVLVFSPDRKILAGRGFDQTTYLWDAETGKELRQIKNKPKEARAGVVFVFGGAGSPSLTFSPDGKTLASTESEFEQRKVSAFIKLSEVETGKEIRRIVCEQNNVSGLAYSPDGKILAFACGNAIRLCESVSGKEIRQLKVNPGSYYLVFSPDGKTLATRPGFPGAAAGSGIGLWDVATGKELRRLGESADNQPGGQVVVVAWGGSALNRDLAFSPDGKVIAGGQHTTLCFWDVGTGKEVALDSSGHRGPIDAVLLAADGKTVVSAGSDNTIRRWESATGKELNRFPVPAGTTIAAFAPDGRTVALGNRDATIRLLETASGKELHKLTGHPGGPLALAFSPAGKLLASRGSDNTIRLIDLATARQRKQITLPGQANPANPGGAVLVNVGRVGGGVSLAFSPDGKTLATSNRAMPNVWVRGVQARDLPIASTSMMWRPARRSARLICRPIGPRWDWSSRPTAGLSPSSTTIRASPFTRSPAARSVCNWGPPGISNPTHDPVESWLSATASALVDPLVVPPCYSHWMAGNWRREPVTRCASGTLSPARN